MTAFAFVLTQNIGRLDSILKLQGYEGPFDSRQNGKARLATDILVGGDATIAAVASRIWVNKNLGHTVSLTGIAPVALEPSTWEFLVCEIPADLRVIAPQGGLKGIDLENLFDQAVSRMLDANGQTAMYRPMIEFFAGLPTPLQAMQAEQAGTELAPQPADKGRWLKTMSVALVQR